MKHTVAELLLYGHQMTSAVTPSFTLYDTSRTRIQLQAWSRWRCSDKTSEPDKGDDMDVKRRLEQIMEQATLHDFIMKINPKLKKGYLSHPIFHDQQQLMEQHREIRSVCSSNAGQTSQHFDERTTNHRVTIRENTPSSELRSLCSSKAFQTSQHFSCNNNKPWSHHGENTQQITTTLSSI